MTTRIFEPSPHLYKFVSGGGLRTFRESSSLYVTLPPRYRINHFQKRMHDIHDKTFFIGINNMSLFMKEPNISASRGIVQFSNAILRRLFWEYYFNGRGSQVELALSNECNRIKNVVVEKKDFSGMSDLDRKLAIQDEEERRAGVARMRTDVGFIDDLDYFRKLYQENGWEPSYHTGCAERLNDTPTWDGTPVHVTTGSVASYSPEEFNVYISNLPTGAQEWFLDEWYRDNIIENVNSFGSIVPQLRRRVIHLEEGGRETHEASLYVSVGKHRGTTSGSELLNTVVEVLRETPFMGQNLDVTIKNDAMQ